jgi:hypothetical protein
MNTDLLELYSDYLLSAFSYTTALEGVTQPMRHGHTGFGRRTTQFSGMPQVWYLQHVAKARAARPLQRMEGGDAPDQRCSR